ncbi:class I SAM-dependent methyltransferase [Nocardia harenae]|uniref:class I SAM-dependent methyltransferase n=1 Tax=Nocardia harenae TaxID=358707 RepID=UPI000833CDD9|nr:class I SAM-dependent methyltransferase [Nocardia harenae]
MPDEAVAAAYDAVAELYTDVTRDQVATDPYGRALFTAFAEQVRGPVLDAGCGPGRITAHLRDLGLAISGLDLSERLIETARSAYPDLRFDLGDLSALPHGDGTLGGIVSWYSFIHIPPERLPSVFAEFARALAPGGKLLLGFFAEEPGAQPAPFDHRVIRAYRWAPDRLAELLAAAGLTATAWLLREPYPKERFRQAIVLAERHRPDVFR